MFVQEVRIEGGFFTYYFNDDKNDNSGKLQQENEAIRSKLRKYKDMDVKKTHEIKFRVCHY